MDRYVGNTGQEVLEIVQAASLLDIVSERIQLKQAGREWAALCPFHVEKTPSFSVNPEKNVFYCHGCHVGGGPLTFLKLYDKMSGKEAMEELCRRTGMSLPDRGGQRTDRSELEPLYGALQWAARLYQKAFYSQVGTQARSYLERRGLREETWKTFGLGWAPAGGTTLVQRASDAGFSIEILQKAGLLMPPKNGMPVRDRFFDRLLFPITDEGGRPIAFGGRILEAPANGKRVAKYVNSPESVVYHKKSHLFGLSIAKAEALRSGRLAVVEGYTDCLMAHQSGIQDTVAVQGTALTLEHAHRIARIAERQGVVLVFDSDAAGERAVDRGLATLLQRNLPIRVAVLPEGKDPHDVVLEEGPEAFRARIDGAEDFFDYKLERARSQNNLSTIEGQTRAIHEMIAVARSMGDPVKRTVFLREVSTRFKIDEDSVRNAYEKTVRKVRRPSHPASQPKETATDPLAEGVEEFLIQTLIHAPNLRKEVHAYRSAERFEDSQLGRIAKLIQGLEREFVSGDLVDVQLLTTFLEDPEDAGRAIKIASRHQPETDYSHHLESLGKRLGRRQGLQKVHELRQELSRAEKSGNEERINQLLIDIQDCNAKIGAQCS